MATFQVGDVVELRSIGPNMTVEAVKDETVHCVWFSSAEVKRAYFPADTLKKSGGDSGH
ncbi:MAG: DUF2158 domain-containing protein [Alphaproteobacteria bacterium]|nr:DUF2158 domain-containing protein [Alphaproteobacteria bacterium]